MSPPADTGSTPADASGSTPSPLLGPIFARGEAAAQSTERGLLVAMLDVEAALARAGARRGLIPTVAGERIAAVCDVERYDIAAIGVEGARHAQPVVALVSAIRAQVGAEVAPHVHHGATSQDIVDTALMLVARRALTPLVADLRRGADVLGELALLHARTAMIGRTLMQQALPISFGWKASRWMSELDGVAGGLAGIAANLPVQLGGPVGALHDPELVAALAGELGLAAAPVAWQSDRRPVAALGTALGIGAGTLAKFARDVILMTQNEVGELRESGDGGGSSSMAHKHNPVAAISVVACAHRVPGLVTTLLSGMAGEHERAAGVWQAEWPTLLELLSLTGSAACGAADLAARLEVDADAMAANLGDAVVDPSVLDVGAAAVRAALEVRRA